MLNSVPSLTGAISFRIYNLKYLKKVVHKFISLERYIFYNLLFCNNIIPQGNIASSLGDTIHLKAVLVADSYDWVSVPADNH